jgi:hypothetical protein
MAERGSKFRVIVADTHDFIRKVPIEVPTFVKMLFRNGNWEPWNDQTFDTYEEAKQYKDSIGFMGTVDTKNSHVKDVEEILV